MADTQNKKLWTVEEDQTLRKAVSMLNNDKWNDIGKKFEELHYEAYGIVVKRAGKQCRERWYNKLHPDLIRTLAPWSKQESVALLTIYQQMGPKWAKIIFRLCEQGYDRRSDNNIKNHFHMIVKKSLKDLTQFIEQHNQKVKQTILSNKVKKTYFYQKTYSIEKLMRKQLQQKIAVNDKLLTEKNNNINNIIDQQNDDNRKQGCKMQIGKNRGQNAKLQWGEWSKSQSLKSETPQSQQRQQQQRVANPENSNDTNNNPSTANNKKTKMSWGLLRIIDKKSIDRFWLWSNDKSTGRLQILSTTVQDTELRTARNLFIQYMKHPQSFTPQQIKQLIQQINNYTKCCKKLNKKKRQKIIKQKQDKTKFYIEKIAKRIFDSVVAERPEMKKTFMVNKVQIVQRIVFLVTTIYNKYAMFKDEEKSKDEVISKRQEGKIAKQIIEEIIEAEKNDDDDCNGEMVIENIVGDGNQNKIELDIKQVINDKTEQQQKQLQQQKKLPQHNQKLPDATVIEAQKVKKIRKYNRKNLLQKKQKSKNKQKKQIDNLPKIEIKREQQQSCKDRVLLVENNEILKELQQKQNNQQIQKINLTQKQVIPILPQLSDDTNNDHTNNSLTNHFPLLLQIKKQQSEEFNVFAFQTIQQINSSLSDSIMFEQKDNKERENNNNKNNSGKNYLAQVKIEDNFWNTIKMAQESEKTTEANHNVGLFQNQFHNQFHRQYHHHQQNQHINHYVSVNQNNPQNTTINNHSNQTHIDHNKKSPQTHFNLQFNRPFEDKHIESQHSEYSVKSRKSLRPNKVFFREEKKFEEMPLQNKGSFSQIEKKFPDALVRSIEFGQDIPMNNFCGNCFNPFIQSDQMRMSQSKLQPQPGFMFFNQLPQLQQQPKSPFRTFNPDPFRPLTSSQQFLINNSIFGNKASSTNYQTLQKPKSIFNNSQQFLAMSCENLFNHNNVERNIGCGEQKKQCNKIDSQQQNANVNNNREGNLFDNSFFQTIRNVEEKPECQWKQQPKIFNFEQQKDQLLFPYSRLSREIHHFNPFISQPLDFEIPQKLIETIKNPHFPIKNYNDYSLNYQHANSLEYSKIFQFEKNFGLNSARLSQIDLFRSQDRSYSHRSRSKDHDVGSNIFKSQRINSIHDSCQQFMSKSRQLSNSCIYSNHEDKSYGSSKQLGQNGRNIIQGQIIYNGHPESLFDSNNHQQHHRR